MSMTRLVDTTLVRSLFTWMAVGCFCPIGAGLARAQLSPVIDVKARAVGMVSGRLVSGEFDAPAEGLRVEVLGQGLVEKTDARGGFTFPALKPGLYTLRVSGEGFSRLEITDVVVRPGGHLTLAAQSMPIVLRNGEVQTLANVVVSARRLQGVDEAMELLEKTTVTGSMLRRVGSRAYPVRRLDREEIARRGAITPAFLLSTVPQVSGLPLNESSLAGTSARGDNATVNLRGMGSGNTLFLLNGRRVVSHPIAPIDEFSIPTLVVNVNQLPMHGLRSVEIVTGAATSTYGFDAVAGAIDYRMDHDFEGDEVTVQATMPEAGGGEEWVATLIHGQNIADGRGHWLSVIDHYHRESLFLRDRDFSAEANHSARAPAPFATSSSAFNDETTTGFFPSFRVGTSNTTMYFRPTDGAGSTPGLTAVAPQQGLNPEYFLNVNAFQTGLPETDRLNWYNSFAYELNKNVSFFGEASVYDARSHIERQPIPYSGVNGVDRLVVLSADNPYNPFGSRFYSVDGSADPATGQARLTGAPQELTLLTESVADVGPERIDVHSQVFRFLGGLRGKIGDGWTWETGALYTFAETKDQSQNQVRESLLQAAAQKTDPTAFNPFGYTFKVQDGAVVADEPYTNPAEALDAFMSPFLRVGKTSLGSLDFRVVGEFDTFQDKFVEVAVGSEVRRETYSDWREAYAGLNPVGSGLDLDDNDFVQASPSSNSVGERWVGAIYAEMAVPLVDEANGFSFARSVEVSLAGRYENYDDFGHALAPRMGVHWRVTPSLQLHGSLDRSFRAPNLALLHAAPRIRVQTGVSDGYRRTVNGEGTASVNVLYGGNGGLKAEEATGVNFGVVTEVPFVKGLTLTADFWTTRRSNVIGTDTTGEIVRNDERLLNAYVQSAIAAGVPVGQIDLGSGTSYYVGDPRVVRDAPSAQDRMAFNTYNAAQPAERQRAVVGRLVSAERPFANSDDGYVSGVDFGAEYTWPTTAWGKFNMVANAAYLSAAYVESGVPMVRDNLLGEDGMQRLRTTTTFEWQGAHWGAGIWLYYVSPFQDTEATISETAYEAWGRPDSIVKVFDEGAFYYRYEVPASVSADFMISYRSGPLAGAWWRDTTVRLKVTNFTDEKPPLTSDSRGFSMRSSSLLLAGRTWSLEVSRRF